MKINDGTGNGSSAKVDSNNNLHVFAITETETDHASDTGNKYNLNTDDINLTSANESACFYLKNNEEDTIVITSFIYSLGTSTGGSGDFKVNIYRNPTAGDIITNAVAMGANSNMNFGSERTMLIDVYKGAEAATQSGGSLAITSRIAGSGRSVIALGAVDLPKGASISVTVTPPGSNTSVDVQVAASCYLKTEIVAGK
jgi:hypothetical protein